MGEGEAVNQAGTYTSQEALGIAMARMRGLPDGAGPEILDAYCDVGGDPELVVRRWEFKQLVAEMVRTGRCEVVDGRPVITMELAKELPCPYADESEEKR